METIATGLLIPEGPIAMDDGSALVMEVGRGMISRVRPDGAISLVADVGGGANGGAIGPDGALYVCNNGGGYDCEMVDGQLRYAFLEERYVGGSIQRVDLGTGAVSTLYRECDGKLLLAPNDMVVDAAGGLWFTDMGRGFPDAKAFGAIFYARPEGGSIRQVRAGLLSPNGIGLSPDGRWLYWADTLSARLWRAAITAPGTLADHGPAGGEVVATGTGNVVFDSLAVEAGGRVCIGSIYRGGIMVADPDLDPDAGHCELVPLDDAVVTNICFGGADMRDVWITAAGTGRLLRGRWPRPGLRLAFNA